MPNRPNSGKRALRGAVHQGPMTALNPPGLQSLMKVKVKWMIRKCALNNAFGNWRRKVANAASELRLARYVRSYFSGLFYFSIFEHLRGAAIAHKRRVVAPCTVGQQ